MEFDTDQVEYSAFIPHPINKAQQSEVHWETCYCARVVVTDRYLDTAEFMDFAAFYAIYNYAGNLFVL